MRRYTKEFINEQIQLYLYCIKQGAEGSAMCADKVQQLRRILNHCEKGIITNYETVKLAVAICES